MGLKIWLIALLTISLNPINSAFARHGWWVEEHAKALHEEYPIYTIRTSIKGIGDYYRAGRVATTELQRDYVEMLDGDLLSATPSDSFFYETVTNELLTTGKSDLSGFGTLNAHEWTARVIRNPQKGGELSAASSNYVRFTNSDAKMTALDFATRNIYSAPLAENTNTIKALFVSKIQAQTNIGNNFRKEGFGNFFVSEMYTPKGYTKFIQFKSSDGLEKKLGD